MGIVGMIVGSFVGSFLGTGIVCSGVGVGSGVGMTGGACEIVRYRRLAMDSTGLVVVSP